MIKLKELKEVCNILGFNDDVNIEYYNDRIVLSVDDEVNGVDIFSDIDLYNLFLDKLDDNESDMCSVIMLDEDNEVVIGIYDYRNC